MPQKTLAQVLHENGMTGQDYPKHAADLNAPTVISNPVTVAPQVAKPVTLKMVMANVPPAEMVKCYQLPGFIDDVRRAIDSDDREYMGILIQIAAAANAITSGANSTVTKLQTLLTATEADPTWTATILGPSIAQAAGLGVVTAAMVQAADQLTGGAGQYGNG